MMRAHFPLRGPPPPWTGAALLQTLPHASSTPPSASFQCRPDSVFSGRPELPKKYKRNAGYFVITCHYERLAQTYSTGEKVEGKRSVKRRTTRDKPSIEAK